MNASDQSIQSGEYGATAGWERLSRCRNRFGCAGYSANSAVNAIYEVRHRTLSAPLGRWLTRDPLDYEDAPSLYSYAGSAPIQASDPLGLKLWAENVFGPIKLGCGGYNWGHQHHSDKPCDGIDFLVQQLRLVGFCYLCREDPHAWDQTIYEVIPALSKSRGQVDFEPDQWKNTSHGEDTWGQTVTESTIRHFCVPHSLLTPPLLRPEFWFRALGFSPPGPVVIPWYECNRADAVEVGWNRSSPPDFWNSPVDTNESSLYIQSDWKCCDRGPSQNDLTWAPHLAGTP